MIGASLGPYQVLEKLGEGGMGEVYLAVDTRLGRRVALKYLSDPLLDLPRTRQRLLREARAAAQITHPNIAAIYDILDTAAHPCIVMEYAHGETLARMAERGPVPFDQVVSIGLQLADALAHAHAAGVIHRDLKPANVVLTPGGTAKILDFGVARVHDIEQDLAGADALTREAIQSFGGNLAGTPAYMAPDQLAGRPASPLSDIYSLGVTLYELLTGRRPFAGRTTAELVYQVMASPTPLVSATVGSVPPLLNAIVAKAMARDAGARYESAAAMADDLRRAARACVEDPAWDRSASLTADLPHAPRRWRRAAGITAAIAALALLVVYALRPGSVQPPVPGTQFVAVLPFVSGTGDSISFDAVGFSESLASALEGLSSVAVLSRPDAAEYLRAAADLPKRVAELGLTMVVSGRASTRGATRQFDVEMKRPDGRRVFAGTYKGEAAEMPALQRRAAADVVSALRVPLTPADRERLVRVPACLPGAYRDYAAGRALLTREDVTGNAAKAEESFARAAANDPKCAPAFAGLADARWARFRETGEPALVEGASQAIETACALDPASPAINISLATVYLGRGKAEQAERIIRAVIERRPYDDEPHRILSDILDRQERTEEAMAEVRLAVNLRPTNVINHVALGNALYNAGRFADAATQFLRVLDIQPDNQWAMINLGSAYYMSGNPEKALAAYGRVEHPDATILSNTGGIYLAMGRNREAADVLRKAIALDPRNDLTHRNLGDAYARLGSPREAQGEYRQAADLTSEWLKVNEKDAKMMARHALCEAKLGRAAEAVQYAEQAVALRPDANGVLYKRAAVHALLGQRAEAVKWLRQAIEKGYSRQDARVDHDLDSIRALPEVVELLRDPR